jgi:hypothetical protein
MADAKKTAAPIGALLKERRKFAPSCAFATRAHVSKESVYRDAARNPVKFREGWAKELEE